MKKNYFNIDDFEAISETSENQLIGGFSASVTITSSSNAFDNITDNNCDGGNCSSGCGSGQNVSKCNTVAGCGSQK